MKSPSGRANRTSGSTASSRPSASNHPDPGIHSSLAYLLRRWGMGSDVKLFDTALAGKPPGGRSWYVNSLGMTMAVVVPKNDRPPASGLGRLPARFAIATTETPLALFQEFDPAHAARRKKERGAEPDNGPDLPADVVSYFDAARFCNWLSEREHVSPAEWCYQPGASEGVMAANFAARRGYRLPTVPEWEYAARAGTTTGRYFGQELTYIDSYVWHRNNTASHPNPIGLLRPNDLGLFDVIGNVAEWCYNPNPSDHSNCIVCPPGAARTSARCVPRHCSGGHFVRLARDQGVRNPSAYYDKTSPSNRWVFSGFRVVKNEP